MLVRVWNDNQFDHTEKFRGETITVKAGDFIEMEREDAVLFKSAFYPPKFNKGGVQERESMKIIRIEPIKDKVQAPDKTAGSDEFKCQACNQHFKNKAGLHAHIAHKHSGQMVDEDARDELLKV